MATAKEFVGPTIEQRGIGWGEKVKERMLARKEPAVVIVRKTEEYDHFRKLPRLGGGRHLTDIRFDPISGKIYHTTWREKRTITQDGRRFLRPPKKGELPEYEVFLPRGRRHSVGYLENLPLQSPVQELLFHHTDTVEEAILKMKEILQGGIREQAQEVVSQTAKLANRFIERGLTESSLQELKRETGEFLQNVGLANPTTPSFQRVMEKFKKACERDSRGRINNLVSRIRVQSVYMWAVKRLVVGSFVERKHGENLNILVYEREITRWALGNAARQLESFLGHVAFRHPERGVSRFQFETMAEVIKNITYGWSTFVQVAPYLVPARAAAINLVGCREERKEVNRQILGKQAEELFAFTPVTQLLREGKVGETSLRVKTSRDILEKVLKDNVIIKPIAGQK